MKELRVRQVREQREQQPPQPRRQRAKMLFFKMEPLPVGLRRTRVSMRGIPADTSHRGFVVAVDEEEEEEVVNYSTRPRLLFCGQVNGERHLVT